MIDMHKKGYFGERYELTIDEAIEKEYICDYIVRINSSENKNTKIIEIFKDKLLKPWKTIIFCDTTTQADALRDFLRGELKYEYIYSYHSKSKRDDILTIFSQPEPCILCVCDMLSAGYDQPDVDTIIHYNLNKSNIRNIQRNGRGNRKAPNKYCNSIYYFINKPKDIKIILNHLSDDKRISKYSILPVYKNMQRDGVTQFSGGKISCNIDMKEPITLTRELVKELTGGDDPKKALCRFLKHVNKYNIRCIDKTTAIDNYKMLFPDIIKICEGIENFPKFCLGKKFNEYISQFITDTETIYNICKLKKVYTIEKYKLSSTQLKLPPYEFIINGGMPEIKNLSQFLPQHIFIEEN